MQLNLLAGDEAASWGKVLKNLLSSMMDYLSIENIA